MQVERERICRCCEKLLNPPQGKRVPVVSVFNRFKYKELLAASGQESVVLAAEVERLGNSLHRGVLPFLCQTSRSCGSFLHSNNKPLQQTFGEAGRLI